MERLTGHEMEIIFNSLTRYFQDELAKNNTIFAYAELSRKTDRLWNKLSALNEAAQPEIYKRKIMEDEKTC